MRHSCINIHTHLKDWVSPVKGHCPSGTSKSVHCCKMPDRSGRVGWRDNQQCCHCKGRNSWKLNLTWQRWKLSLIRTSIIKEKQVRSGKLRIVRMNPCSEGFRYTEQGMESGLVPEYRWDRSRKGSSPPIRKVWQDFGLGAIEKFNDCWIAHLTCHSHWFLLWIFYQCTNKPRLRIQVVHLHGI